MKQRPGRYLTQTEMAEVWGRWDLARDVVKAFGDRNAD
jgi:hypothetical protein